jgi:hypothetical protein
MNREQRRSFRIQVPEGRERGTLYLGAIPVEVRIMDESAGGYAVALLTDAEIQQNQVLVLKTATGTCQARVARIEQFDDGQLLGLVRLEDVDEAPEPGLQSSWREGPHPLEKAFRGGWTTGIAAVLAGALFSGLAWYFLAGSGSKLSAGFPI